MQHLMDTTNFGPLGMEPDFNTDVKQILQGFPAVPFQPPVVQPVTPSAITMPTAVPLAPSAAPITTSTRVADSAAASATILDTAALSTGPASRRRGLEYARHVKACAREEFKEKRRIELEASGEGDRTKRRKKNDTSMNEKQKYRRRLQKNQDSAAAARHAQDAYLKNLETQANAFDSEMCALENKLRRSHAEKEEISRLNAVLMDHTRNLEAELQRLREISMVAANNNKNANNNNNNNNTSSNNANINPIAFAFDEIVGGNHTAFTNNTSLENKALLEEYSAPAFSYPNTASKTHKITPAF